MTDYETLRDMFKRAIPKKVEFERWMEVTEKVGYPGITVNGDGCYTVYSFAKDGSLSSINTYIEGR